MARLIGKEYRAAPLASSVTGSPFAEAIGEDARLPGPGCRPAAGYAEQVAPPTFVTTMQIMASGQVVGDRSSDWITRAWCTASRNTIGAAPCSSATS